MGSKYENGLGVKRDLWTVIQWYQLAAAQGDKTPVQNRRNLAMQT